MDISFGRRPTILLSMTLLSLVTVNVLAEDGPPFVRSLTVATELDKNQFYSPEIFVEFRDEILYPDFDVSAKKLANAETILKVWATGFVGTLDLNHVIYMTKNNTICQSMDINGNVSEITEAEADYPNYRTTFTKAYIERPDTGVQQELTKVEPIGNLAFLETDASGLEKYTNYPFTLKFADMPLQDRVYKCEGEIQVMVGFEG